MWANLGMLCFRPRIARACEAAREAGAEATGNGESQITKLVDAVVAFDMGSTNSLCVLP